MSLDNEWLPVVAMAFTCLCSLNLVRILAQVHRKRIEVWVPGRERSMHSTETVGKKSAPRRRHVSVVDVEAVELQDPGFKAPRALTFEDRESADRAFS